MTISFDEYPQFKPNLTPRQIFELGSFMDKGGYWRPVYSSVLDKNLENCHLEFRKYLFYDLPEYLLVNNDKNALLNRYKVKCGSSLSDWESKNWISKHDPYGWVQWYCRFYCRYFYQSYSKDFKMSDEIVQEDQRQIQRWVHFTGENGRWKRYLLNLIVKKKTTFDDMLVSPITRQNLQHWGYQITQCDLDKFVKSQDLSN